MDADARGTTPVTPPRSSDPGVGLARVGAVAPATCRLGAERLSASSCPRRRTGDGGKVTLGSPDRSDGQERSVGNSRPRQRVRHLLGWGRDPIRTSNHDDGAGGRAPEAGCRRPPAAAHVADWQARRIRPAPAFGRLGRRPLDRSARPVVVATGRAIPGGGPADPRAAGRPARVRPHGGGRAGGSTRAARDRRSGVRPGPG